MESTLKTSDGFVCPRCGYSTNYSTSYLSHIHRAKPCGDTMFSGVTISDLRSAWDKRSENKIKCQHCDKPFTSRAQKCYHLKNCSVLKSTQSAKSDTPTPDPVQEPQSASGPSLVHTQTITGNSNTTVNNNTTINNTTINVTLSSHGSENIGYLTQDWDHFTEFVFNSVLAKHEKGIVEFVRLKYFHPDHPENHTVRMIRLTQGTEQGVVEVWNGRRWIEKVAEDIIGGMICDIEGDLSCAVGDGILGDDADKKLSKRRRKILDGAMHAIGHLEIQFTDVKPEGTYRWDKARGKFVSISAFEEMKEEDREKREVFYRELERAMQNFQQAIPSDH